MRVRVDPHICQGHGLCQLSAPGIFAWLDEEGLSYAPSELVSPQNEQAALLAARSCPERAIVVDHADGG
jgi:ferredoxin